MKTFESKSSRRVIVTTLMSMAGVLIIVISLLIGTFSSQFRIWSFISSTATILFAIGLLSYYYSNSLNTINLKNGEIILIKNFGRKSINVIDINYFERLSSSNLFMSSGSSGLFGFIGSTLDFSYSYIKDKSKMVKISTRDKDYIISCDNPDELVASIKEIVNKDF